MSGTLVLSRKKNQKVIINHNIEVTVVDIRGDKCRLAFKADRSIPIHREEIELAIQSQAEPIAS